MNYKIALGVFLCSSIALWATEPFIVPKKAKKVSNTAIKEKNIAPCLADVIVLHNDAIKNNALMQKQAIKMTTELLEQCADSFFAKAEGKKLQEYDAALHEFKEVFTDCQKKIMQAYNKVQAVLQ
ncbi:MAG: hypothetical protein AB7E68_04275 [Candidatus Babeliales bacterium]